MGSDSATLIELRPTDDDDLDADDGMLPVPQLHELNVHARQVLNLELQGLRKADIAIRLGLHENRVSGITRAPSYIAARTAMLDRGTNAALRALMPMAIRTLEQGFHSPNEYIRMMAAGMLFKILGYMHHGKECEAYANGGVTATEICRRLMEKAQERQGADHSEGDPATHCGG
jgi:hypothetical protein